MPETREIGLSVLGQNQEEHGRRIEVEKGVMALNNQWAAKNRALLKANGVSVVNLLSSPGSGKTTLLARTLQDLAGEAQMAVIVGDLATDNDARRLRVGGATAVQIQTGAVCHLEAAMVARALQALDLGQTDLLFIENVGNLVCPAAYDLGEEARIVLLCVTEGEDKPLKYPKIFKSAELVLLSKSDLADAAGFNRAVALENLHLVAPSARVLEVSARSGQGLQDWYTYLLGGLKRSKRSAASGGMSASLGV